MTSSFQPTYARLCALHSEAKQTLADFKSVINSFNDVDDFTQLEDKDKELDTALSLCSLSVVEKLTRRIELIERRKVLRQRLFGLPVQEKKLYERTFLQLSLFCELCGLGYFNERKSRREMVERVRSWLDDFLFTDDKQDISKKGRALKEFHDRVVV
ncbi:hypothetical protein PRIPAC_93860 [Pristionchus pacificus]|uniref:Uncharacterized protein n=1 Tax=Pristionchus pacificus TaxID=54126 RepID=A0A454XVS9_PRIPA|nr:hypothetical protein PRIPAC_93860 [Pristionchus pacificus]|eukprot:PDM77863.1 hypothetical protein PRIPAC_34730 [Pristionchus pacificus]